MSKRIYTIIDERGDVEFHFTGFEGRTCEAEEERMRRGLAALGLQAKVLHVTHTEEGNGASITRSVRNKVR